MKYKYTNVLCVTPIFAKIIKFSTFGGK